MTSQAFKNAHVGEDHRHGVEYWRNREFKKFAVHVIIGPERAPTYEQIWYAHCRTAAQAIAVVKRDAVGLPSRTRARYCARLAGPRELGCVVPGVLA